MANKHILSLEVQPVANCEILSIRDTSQYTDDLAIDCPELLITAPGFNSPTLIKVQPYFDLKKTYLLNLKMGDEKTILHWHTTVFETKM